MDILTLLPQFGGLIWTLVAFVIALSVIVAIHEYGHYIVGRWSGIHADIFSLGFGPVLYARTDKRGTVWQIAALPFGGYVKFRGDANAASAPDGAAVRDMSPEEKRSTMAGAPLWARTATVAAGPIFNFVLAIAVFTAVGMTRGVAVDPLTVGEMRPLPQATALQSGDVLVAIGGQAVPSFDEENAFDALIESLPEAPNLTYTVERGGSRMELDGPWLLPPVVTQLAPQSAAPITARMSDSASEASGSESWVPGRTSSTTRAPLATEACAMPRMPSWSSRPTTRIGAGSVEGSSNSSRR